jgi:hypothetical protein
LHFYSYCPELDECLPDKWNFYNKFCPSAWKEGYLLDIDADCEAVEAKAICPPKIIGSDKNAGTFHNFTKYLPMGGKCTIEVDAGAMPTILVFDNQTKLGVLANNYKVGKDNLRIDQGSTKSITIYNGYDNTTSFSMTYGYGYKGAMHLSAFSAALALVSTIVYA